jgi:hypothetical protein
MGRVVRTRAGVNTMKLYLETADIREIEADRRALQRQDGTSA